MSTRTVDAVVIGAGHHGLVAAAMLADAGWEVAVLEGRNEPGGAIASRTIDGFVVDEFSSCYPLGRASPVLRSLELEAHDLQWLDHRPSLAHVSAPMTSSAPRCWTPHRPPPPRSTRTTPATARPG